MKKSAMIAVVLLAGCAAQGSSSIAPAYTPRTVQAEVPPPPVNTSLPDASAPKPKAVPAQ